MKNTTYLEQVKADIKTWIEDNSYYYDLGDYDTAEDFGEYLNDTLWTDDSVTGNASGSYTFNSEEAKGHVLADTDTVREALTEFCESAERIADAFLNGKWKFLDVTARCYVLGQAIGEIIDECREEIEDGIQERKEELETA